MSETDMQGNPIPWPPPLTAEDEAQHPEWPPIREDAPMAYLCAEARHDSNRTRCLVPICARCWGGTV